ncbi:MAG: sigma-54-dependent Fis family transcriptional regulator, partial [Planctomycetes bacterium]|nr:sigma-54-dependent Fis family transcriptional regulator [Planctomycetota bacterium]
LAVRERKAIVDSLRKYEGNRKQVAINLGISTTTLWRKMKEYQIVPKTSFNTKDS